MSELDGEIAELDISPAADDDGDTALLDEDSSDEDAGASIDELWASMPLDDAATCELDPGDDEDGPMLDEEDAADDGARLVALCAEEPALEVPEDAALDEDAGAVEVDDDGEAGIAAQWAAEQNEALAQSEVSWQGLAHVEVSG